MRRLGPTSSSSTFNKHKNRLCCIVYTSAYAKWTSIFWKRTWESFHQKRSETGTSTTTERVEDQETLETGAIVREFSDSVKDIVNKLFANSVVTSSIVVGSIFFARNQLFWMEELFVWSRSYWIRSLKIVRSYHIDRRKRTWIDNRWFQINKDSSWNVTSWACWWEKSWEWVIGGGDGISSHGTIWADAVFHTVKFPTGISHLDTGLANMNWNNFSLNELFNLWLVHCDSCHVSHI